MKINRLFDILSNVREQFPSKADALACKIDGKWQSHSIKEYYETVRFLSYGLLELGLKKGDRVVTISNNRPEWNFMDMALLQTGLVHVPIYTTLGSSEYCYILEHCEPELLFVSDTCLYQKINSLPDNTKSSLNIYCFDETKEAKYWREIYELGKKKANDYEEKLEELKTSIQPDDVATLLYTSGTTGDPKGVMLSHKNIISNLNGITELFDFGPEDRTLSFLPISHVFERTINYYLQSVGVSIYYAENLGTISANLKEVEPSIFIAVPRVLEKIYDKIIGVGKDLKGLKKQLFFWAVNLGLRFEFDRKNGWFYHIKLSIASKLIFSKWRAAVGGKVRLAVTGGAAMQPRLIRVFNAAGIPLIEGYGMTETSPVIAANDIFHGRIMIGTVGPALPGVEVKIDNDGEILARGDLVMKGYFKNPEQTAEVIDKDGWMHTGDVGELIDGMYVKITDRKKEIFKLSSGKYIAPQAIENIFKESFFIEQLMVVGENEKFASALISPNFQFLHNWCSRHNVKFRDNEDLIANKQVIARYQREVNEMNKHLGQTEQIKRFRLVKEEWTPVTGELSPTLKLKRRFLYDKYSVILSEIFSVQKENS
jgi:long-chain acyl-CoA synthetase